MCAPAAASWTTSPWRALGFAVEEPHRFRYAHAPDPDGKSFSVVGVGDLDCDGTAVTYELRGDTSNGKITTKIVEPPPNSD